MPKSICPHCGAQLNLKDSRLFGQTKRCPGCRQEFVVEPVIEESSEPLDPFGDLDALTAADPLGDVDALAMEDANESLNELGDLDTQFSSLPISNPYAPVPAKPAPVAVEAPRGPNLALLLGLAGGAGALFLTLGVVVLWWMFSGPSDAPQGEQVAAANAGDIAVDAKDQAALANSGSADLSGFWEIQSYTSDGDLLEQANGNGLVLRSNGTFRSISPNIMPLGTWEISARNHLYMKYHSGNTSPTLILDARWELEGNQLTMSFTLRGRPVVVEYQRTASNDFWEHCRVRANLKDPEYAALQAETGDDIPAAAKLAKDDLLRQQLLNIGIGMYNFHDVYNSYPAPDRMPSDIRIRTGSIKSEGLSWRVYILPYIGQRRLFDEFHLDEPWDSPHNQQLVERMPADYETEGAASGKTSLHLIVGEGTVFGGEKPPRVNSVRRGDSTLMFVQGGTEVATEWTRPGGIPFDPASGIKILGTPPTENGFPMGLMNATVAYLPPSFSAEEFTSLVSLNAQSRLEPSSFVAFEADIQAQKDAAEAERLAALQMQQELEEKQRFEQSPIGKMQLVTAAIQSYSSMGRFPHHSIAFGKDTALSWRVYLLPHFRKPELTALFKEFHFEEPWDSEHNLTMLQRMPDVYRFTDATDGKTTLRAFSGPNTLFGGEQAASIDRNKQPVGGNPATITIFLGNEATAIEWTRPSGIPFDAANPVAMLGKDEGEYLVATADGEVKRVSTIVPEEVYYDPQYQNKMAEAARLAEQQSKADAKLARLRPELERLAAVYQRYKEDGTIGRLEALAKVIGKDISTLDNFNDGSWEQSWRLNALIMSGKEQALELAKMYNRKEPWNSPNNLKLLNAMPAAFRTPGVTEAGKTALHVFVPSNSKSIRTYGKSAYDIHARDRTILLIQGPPESAVEWTRKGGLEFVPPTSESNFVTAQWRLRFERPSAGSSGLVGSYGGAGYGSGGSGFGSDFGGGGSGLGATNPPAPGNQSGFGGGYGGGGGLGPGGGSGQSRFGGGAPLPLGRGGQNASNETEAPEPERLFDATGDYLVVMFDMRVRVLSRNVPVEVLRAAAEYNPLVADFETDEHAILPTIEQLDAAAAAKPKEN